MSQDVSQIVVGANGVVRVAPLGTTLPTTPTATPAGAFVDLGFVSEDGVTANDAKTLAEIKVWQLFYTARRIVTARDFMLKFVLKQWSKDTVPFAFGGGTVAETSTGSGFYKYSPPAPEVIDERILMVDWSDGTKVYRMICPKGMVTEGVETKLARADSADLPITFGINGQAGVLPWYLLTNDAAFA